MDKKFYITTPIYYVNDKPHIGHAYTTVTADILARVHKQRGEGVFFLVGADEHGAKVAQAAQKAGLSPKEFCNQKAQEFKDAWASLNIDYSNFLRTTDPLHEAAVQRAVQAIYDKGLIYKGEYEGLYCAACEQYKNSDDLINGKCPDHNIEVQEMKEDCYFFKLSHFQNTLLGFIESDELKIEPKERKNEVVSFLKSGLKDISISRQNVGWGISLPFDKKFTIYVWVDAFLNYLTGLSWSGQAGERPEYFPPDIQLMSKDIVRVHATIWPSLLLALGLPLPKKIFVHGYFTINGQKMSKSLGNVIWPQELVQKFGTDASRYLLMSPLSFGADGDISWEKLIERYNAELANGLGNLLSRVIKLNEKIIAKTDNRSQKQMNLKDLYDEMKLKEILDLIFEQVNWANKRIEETKLWELVKNDPHLAKKILGELLALLDEIAEALLPFMPETSGKIKNTLKLNKSEKALFPRLI